MIFSHTDEILSLTAYGGWLAGLAWLSTHAEMQGRSVMDALTDAVEEGLEHASDWSGRYPVALHCLAV